MATHSSVLFLGNLRHREAWWAAVYGVAQSRTRLTRLSSSSSMVSLEAVMAPVSVACECVTEFAEAQGLPSWTYLVPVCFVSLGYVILF